MLSSLLRTSLLAASVSSKILYAGVAESSGEFGVYSSTATPGTGLPGRFGVDYAFINEQAIDTYVDINKINLFRIAFLLERMCPPATGLGSTFNETHFDYFKQAVDYVSVTKGAYVILDPHNYMRYNDPSQQPATGSVIGSTTDPKAATIAQFQDFWQELAMRFADNEKVIFSIMNEPHDMPTQLLLEDDQAAIDGIRASGAKQLIIAPGNGYSGGHSWNQTYTGTDGKSSADLLYQLKDPLNNTAFDVHEYLDQDFSGSHQNCTQPGPPNLAGVTAWLKEHGFKAFITEFGVAPNTGCLDMLDEYLDYLSDNDVWIGWTAWAAGPFWGTNSPCCSDSTPLGSLEPGSKTGTGQPGEYDTIWQTTIQKHVPDDLVREGLSSVNGGEGTNTTLASRRFRRSNLARL